MTDLPDPQTQPALIETTSWYLGLLQAALARVALEGQN
jgi:hypothetical protein